MEGRNCNHHNSGIPRADWRSAVAFIAAPSPSAIRQSRADGAVPHTAQVTVMKKNNFFDATWEGYQSSLSLTVFMMVMGMIASALAIGDFMRWMPIAAIMFSASIIFGIFAVLFRIRLEAIYAGVYGSKRSFEAACGTVIGRNSLRNSKYWPRIQKRLKSA